MPHKEPSRDEIETLNLKWWERCERAKENENNYNKDVDKETLPYTLQQQQEHW